MIDTLTAPFTFGFMQNAFLMAAVVAPPTALLSCFLVIRGWALLGDAVSHAVLPGIVLAYIFKLPLILGAFAAGMCCAMLTGYLANNSRIKQDTIMGVVFSGMFALGIVLFVSIDTDAHLDHILFGNLLGADASELALAAVIALFVTSIIALKWKDLLLYSFDPAQARAIGLSVKTLHYGLLAILSLTIVATLTASGLILAIGLLIAPGAIAFLITSRFLLMMWLATAICLGAMLGGVYLSFYLDSAPAPTVILILTAIFAAVFTARQLATRRHTARLKHHNG